MKLWLLLSEIQDIHGSVVVCPKFPSELTLKYQMWLQKCVVLKQIIVFKSNWGPSQTLVLILLLRLRSSEVEILELF